MNNKEIGIYVHIPFCKQKCYYCDFVSYSNKDGKINTQDARQILLFYIGKINTL